jgi:hypothetical protein
VTRWIQTIDHLSRPLARWALSQRNNRLKFCPRRARLPNKLCFFALLSLFVSFSQQVQKRAFVAFIMRNRNWFYCQYLTLAWSRKQNNAEKNENNCKYCNYNSHLSSPATTNEHFKVSITISMLIIFDWKWDFKIIFELMRCQCEAFKHEYISPRRVITKIGASFFPRYAPWLISFLSCLISLKRRNIVLDMIIECFFLLRSAIARFKLWFWCSWK